ncbi:MAG: hypothetical protein ACJ746_01515 [Bryobacteraceae bacterium]
MTKTVYHYLNARYALDDIVHGRLKVSLIGEVNDDQELLAANFADFSDEENDKLVRNFKQTTGIMCFSADQNNKVCWERYGDCGRGICLAFGVYAEHLAQVCYVDEAKTIRFPSSLLGTFLTEALTVEVANALHPYVIQKYTTKYKRTWCPKKSDWNVWWPENEWRAFPRLDEDSRTAENLYLSDDWRENQMKLTRVTLGPFCSVPVTDIRDALKSHYRRHPYGEVKIEVAKPSEVKAPSTEVIIC